MRLDFASLVLFFSVITTLVADAANDDHLTDEPEGPLITKLRLGNSRTKRNFFAQIGKLLFAPLLQEERTDNDNGPASKGKLSLRRHLAIGDFAEVNGLLNGYSLDVADSVSTSTTVLGGPLTLTLRNIRCDNVNVGDITVEYDKISDQNLIISSQVVEFDLNCYFSWDYYYDAPIGSFFDLRGSGTCDVLTDNNSASVSLRFDSSDFNVEPPTNVVNNPNERCRSTINIERLTFNGGFSSLIANIAKSLFEDQIEATVETQICSILDSVGGDLGNELLAGVNEFLDPFLDESETENGDPLDPENALDVSNTTGLLNYLESSVASDALAELNDFLGGDPPAINEVLQDRLLDDDGTLTLNITDLNFTSGDGAFNVTPDDGVIYDEHNNLTQAKISVESVKVLGLNSFYKFGPLEAIGKYTLAGSIGLSSISIEVTLNFDVRPSTLPGSLYENPGIDPIITTARIVLGVDDIEASLSALLAVDEVNGTAALQSTDNVVDCLLSSVTMVETSGLDINIGNLREPTLSGFLAPGIDRVATQTSEAVLIMYESAVIQAFENFMEQTLGNVLLPIDQIASSAVCEPSTLSSQSPSSYPSQYPSISPSTLPSISSQSPSSYPSQYPSISPSTLPSIALPEITPNITNITDFGFCFPGESSVQLKNGETVPMNQLKVGDWIRTANDYERIYSFGHKHPDRVAEFVELTMTASGKQQRHQLRLTADHLVYEEQEGFIPASAVKMGHVVIVRNDDSEESMEVTKIRTVKAKGLYAPFTSSGTLLVDGVLASSFIDLSFFGLDSQWVAHTGEFPHRFWCTAVTDCSSEVYDEHGVNYYWGALPMRFVAWLSTAPTWVQYVIQTGLILALSIMSVMEQIWGTGFLTMAVLGSAVVLARRRFATNKKL